ncbi:acyl-CoA synthetase (AMP-forming)/AMP-acid ligase II [Inquilinus ginsengisoli]|uniref:Acyl-CoA synthetase (AMP-forming)/AMP-acid ligase II n=1 Tax=Inquilinus ginsengisoli TaxID=363840 RepID=A0ABU1JHW8_9PROT|nr:class I adenylate-forming enzyme family protein [Inquilinus ginsengisoli]MDR6288204.1 acyl-CoA synthetase (AMP-forming)/AMP-acid ligase II [Inquilinus ginsengisoli]
MTDHTIWAALAAGTDARGLSGLLFARAAAAPDAVAFEFGDEIWTRGRLAAEVEHMARALLAIGLQAGDRIVFHMRSSPELAIGYYACFATGIVAVPMKAELKTAELEALFRRLRPALYIGHPDLHGKVVGIDDEILAPKRRLAINSAAELRAWATRPATAGGLANSVDLDAPAVMLCTSGTTAEPKFVVQSQNTLAHAVAMLVATPLDSEMWMLAPSPMMHMSGLMAVVRSLSVAMPFVLMRRFDADQVLDAIARHRSTYMTGIAYMFSELVEAQKARQHDIGPSRIFVSTGDAVSIELQRRFREVFGVRLHSVWAATEAVGSLAPGPVDGPVSAPSPRAEYRLVDNHGEPVRPGQVGELLLRGPNVTPGYWIAPGTIDSARSNGWFHTGDLMRQDDKGNLWFISRRKELIIRGGSNISPVEVEQVLKSNPAVRDAAVVGVPDAVLGQRVCALVQLAAGYGQADLPDILDHATARLADYKVPEKLLIVVAIPRNTLGKVDRRAASAMVQG